MVTGNTDTSVLDQAASQNGESSETSGEPTGGESQEPQIDWKAKFEEADAREAKLANDLRSERGQRTQAFDDLVESVGGIGARMDVIAKRTASGETEAIADDFTALDQKTSGEKASREWATDYTEAEASLADAVTDDDGTILLDKAATDALSSLWAAAREKQDVNGLYRVISRATRLTRETEKQKAKEDVDKAGKDAEAAKKVSDAKHGINDLSIGTPSGITGGKSIAQIGETTDINDFTDEDYEKWKNQ